MKDSFQSSREKFLGLSLESSRKSYYPQLKDQYRAAEEKQQRLQLLIDNLPVRIAMIDKEERVVLANRAYAAISVLKREEMVGKHLREVLGEENYTTLKPYTKEALSGKEVHYEAPYLTPEKSRIWYEVTLIPVFGGEGVVDGYYVLGRDLTQQRQQEQEQKRLEEQLFGAQKFKAIGTLAGGIAHDFNNLLMGIQGRSSLMRIGLDSSHPLMEHLEAIDEYIASAAHLTRQMLGLTRGGDYEVKPVDLKKLLRESSAMFGRTKKEITLHYHLEVGEIVVEADRRQIEQVLLNMFVNAWQAMPDGGNLNLSLKKVVLSKLDCLAYEIQPGHFAKISVTDTGTGMTEEIRKKVFDPFFTTKEKQLGTGLGLATAYGIIKNHGGIIKVYSEVGRGTTFDIYLPLSGITATSEKQDTHEIKKGEGTVLLVDDEEIILEVGASMLEALGYTVIKANSGKAAVELVSTEGESLDLVVLDMVMPNMDGGKTYDNIQAMRPELPVVLSSGYSLNGEAEAILERGCRGFIQKPFNLTELSVMVRNTMNKYR